MNTHESMKSKSSPPSSGTKDSSAIVLGEEALEEAKFFNTFPLLVHDKVFRKCRRR
jgi:hypothetical protein